MYKTASLCMLSISGCWWKLHTASRKNTEKKVISAFSSNSWRQKVFPWMSNAEILQRGVIISATNRIWTHDGWETIHKVPFHWLGLYHDYSTHYSHIKIIIISTGFTSHREYMGSDQTYSQLNGMTRDKNELAFQAVLSTLLTNLMGFCMKNMVVSKHKASLCSTASSSENSCQIEDQLQRWKWGQGGFFLLLPKSGFFSGNSSPLPNLSQNSRKLGVMLM